MTQDLKNKQTDNILLSKHCVYLSFPEKTMSTVPTGYYGLVLVFLPLLFVHFPSLSSGVIRKKLALDQISGDTI